MFEEVVEPDLYSGRRGLATKGFGTPPPVDILANLQCLYRKPSYQEVDTALLRLKKPMKRMQPVGVMLIGIGEVKLFLLANPDEESTLTEPNLISYALTILTKTGEFMPKASRSGKRGHRRIGKNGPISCPTW